MSVEEGEMGDLTPQQLLAKMDAHLAQQDAYLASRDAEFRVLHETLAQQNDALAEATEMLRRTTAEVAEMHAEASRSFAATMDTLNNLATWLDARLNAQRNLFGERLAQQGGLFEASRDVEGDG
jgi:ABC-type transporter Mla subunit MlaD